MNLEAYIAVINADLELLALPLAWIAVLLSILFMRRADPARAILGRWALWLCVSCGTALLLHRIGASSRPIWASTLFCMLAWQLAETVYNWMAIDAVSRSDLPLFLNYKRSGAGQWPADRTFVTLREEIRREGFRLLASSIGQMNGVDYLRCNIYEDAEKHISLSTLFVPRGSNSLSVFLALTTHADNGRIYITDNMFVPFGGFYPEDMMVERRPLMRSLSRLLGRHRKRLEAEGAKPVPYECDPIEEMNRRQGEVERENLNMGFLVDPQERELHGNISREGRYRLWTELWMLNYFGRARDYCR